MRELAGTLAATADRLSGTVATIGDPTAAEGEVEAARAAAEQRAAAAEEDRARQAHDQLAEAGAAHAAKIERIGRDSQQRIAPPRLHATLSKLPGRQGRRWPKPRQQARKPSRPGSEPPSPRPAPRLLSPKPPGSGKTPPASSSGCAPLPPPSWTGSAPTPPASGTNSASCSKTAACTLTEARDGQRRRAERAEADLDAARAELAQLRPNIGTNLLRPGLSHGLTCGVCCPRVTVRDPSLPGLMAR